ncbi:phosphoadenosine phosphosulfate reductase domain-containing protein [Pseudomonas bohemica]|uniref:phosphoadenosine phosphosulfate reductase domain-containing protein n=1 Tax=Pseudomonas bohemica TaxID=2044872 RepID=UPI000DA61930|nr:phosphoadenosine phosphosulfate reductase family protein [Pseudomonas bohemica]
MSPYKLSGMTVVSFSGGRTSAFMLFMVLLHNTAEDIAKYLLIIFANTGKEHPATLEFVRECAERWGVPIIWLEFRDDDAGFAVVDYATASRHGEPFEALIRKRKYLPNPVTRFCTIDLKIRIIHKYLRSLGLSTEDEPVDMMTGIRADEPRRVAKIRQRKTTSESKHATMVMPLADAGVGVQDVTEFWAAQPFDLMLPTINGRTLEGNCDLCFLKGAYQVYSIIASDRGSPVRKAEWWARMERTAVSSSGITGNGALFRFDRPSYQEMLDYSEIQFDMFADQDEAIACFCGD